MKRGIAFIAILVVFGIVAAVGASGFVVAKNFTDTDAPRQFELFGKPRPTPSPRTTPSPQFRTPSPRSSPSANPSIRPSPTALPSPTGGPIVYRQPQGKYTITLRAGWVVNRTIDSKTYSTTTFNGPNGNISITFGTGKDPIGGCSETTSLQLADRTISACFLLQKDGSQIITRGYTKDKAGLDFTIEAYINSPSNANRQIILDIIKTIDID
ncbi:MAG: hypothetical protein UT12_C0001G0010 [Candidatus Curtissbacteria bacterium GW2011_GWC2_38_9]|uniref:Uncharacterized protein n=3 Tax=Candidatus Curtissiibacteriota TaxID=1752717 RepID=A0A1F5HQL6_9BACT|nr:MAG: hypothetical protein UT12_C0001G0010 [Candidatus Curtissbacteria bacterium GW2011_GWC2_38_9]KKS04408.1 MAG: hypothetical protein UU56_C0006G0012 [Candidatus Curtissbacteria bacterium GW2011_GWA2_41_24]OGD89943.1 MAG: hypothetical protein A2Z54_00755 [Candidatus Curtissbacteria bacterium RIFCSPHIGHO2_02_39_8]OGE06481.1 MAG: hypothetical protein A2W70_01295 [Candidatus Curtissbacteria bacterium RIFCSPLOWO2_02_41_11]